MKLALSNRTGWSLLALVLPSLLGCATTGTESYGSMRAEADRSVADERPQLTDDAGLRGASLDRAAYVRAVLRRNRSLESARQGWRAAVARVRQSGAFEDPMVALEVAPLSVGSPSARFGWSATISQKMPWPGKLALEETVAKAEADAARSDYEGARRDLALAAALLYDDYFVAARSIEINAHHVDLMRAMHAAALSQFEAGHASAQDPLRAEFELTHMEHDTVVLASERDVTVARMNELLHRDPDLPLPAPPKELPRPADLDAEGDAPLESEAVARRPEIASALEHARAERARGERAERESYPDVTVATSYNSMWDMPEHRWMVGLSFNLPVQTARRRGGVDEANAARAQYEADAARIGDMARTQVVVARKELEEARHVVHIFEARLLPIAQQEVDAARAAFVASRAPFVSLVDAEKNLRGVELDHQVAQADCDRRRSELDRSLGRIPGVDGEDAAR